jgi:hypothetical protein
MDLDMDMNMDATPSCHLFSEREADTGEGIYVGCYD